MVPVDLTRSRDYFSASPSCAIMPTMAPSLASKTTPNRAGDALPFGVHTSLQTASKHKKMVSAVLHLKKESGRRGYPTAYNISSKAFGQQKPKTKVE